ncbi:MAG TPA: FG-GAP-like repeat-containing protein, partial [Pyrinomonadaceae bacterium]|nr:FG-GAP-like repeat-containing protein [Pyrinomonadaceae bacterium]
MLAVSKTGDPLGGYFVYEFAMPGVRLNDFPKFGVWPDGYYMSTEEYFGADFVGAGAFAFDREKLLAGDPSATYIYFRLPITAPYRRSSFLPSDLDGIVAPSAGTPNVFASYTATEYGDSQDAIRLFDFHADFQVPQNSSFVERTESPVTVAAFDPTSPDGRPDIAQPSPGERLDSSSDRLNYRLAYRNLGTHQSLVVNQTVRTSAVGDAYRAGVRVYELRRTSGPFTVHEQSTIGDSGSSRWVASAAQDRMGNLAVQYNFVTDEKRVSMLYTGKLASEPSGVFRTEGAIIEGTGVQKAFGWRWGEYSGLNVHPLNDCDFWATNAYYSLESEQMSDFTWLTRIGRFRFNECVPPPIGTLSVRVTSSVTGLPLPGALVNIHPNRDITSNPFRRNTDGDGRLVSVPLPLNQYTVVGSFSGYRSRGLDTTVVAGTPTQVDLSLEPISVLGGLVDGVTQESCRINTTPEPGETVSVNLQLRNTGAASTTSLVATLIENGEIIRASQPQSYGSLPAGGAGVSRPFTFTVNPAVPCGAEITLPLRLQDGASDLGTLNFTLRAGEIKFVLSENFDGATPPALPEGWVTSSTENHQLWRTSTARVQSPPNALFTPDPLQRGENEVVSPPFSITTAGAEVSFRHWYELETTFLRNRLYDGSVLELRYGRGAWQDIVSAGGSFLSGGYDGTIDGCCQNPLAGRQGWSGRSGINQASEYVTTKAKLPAAAFGRSVQLRWRLGTDIGGFREGQYLDDVAVTDGYTCSCAIAPSTAPFDFDGDRKTDLSIVNFTNSVAPDYRWLRSSDGGERSVFWGVPGDVPANADFDGDGKTDIAVFRSGTWHILPSSNSIAMMVSFGTVGDRVVPADFDGDGKADIAVFRPSTGFWYVLRSSDDRLTTFPFGTTGDKPLTGDFDGDSKGDFAVYRPSNGTWYIARSSDGGFTITTFGLSTDLPVPGDFDGDAKTDIAVYRPSIGVWFLL